MMSESDSGLHWDNLTSLVGVPDWSYISSIEISNHSADTIYISATRYKLDDYQPYLYQTKDGGKTWRSIVGNFPEGEITRVIRVDSVRKDLIFVDVETSGLSHTTDRIVKLNLAKVTTEGEVKDGSRVINPGIHIPKESTAIHGLTDEHVVNEPRFENIVDALHTFMSGCDIAGYSVKKFDLPIIIEHFHRAGRPLDLADSNIIDLRNLYMLKEPRTLAGAYAHFVANEFPDSDAKAMVGIYNAQITKYTDIPTSISDLSNLLNDTNDVDLAGKIKRNTAGKLMLSFGKYTDKTLEYIENNDPSYLTWMLDSDYFTIDTKEVIRSNTSVG